MVVSCTFWFKESLLLLLVDIYVWDPTTGDKVGAVFKGHKKYILYIFRLLVILILSVITGISWEPLHKNPKSSRFASASKDGTVKIWDIEVGRAIKVYIISPNVRFPTNIICVIDTLRTYS